jgi:hypothetical protein
MSQEEQIRQLQQDVEYLEGQVRELFEAQEAREIRDRELIGRKS